MNSIDRRIVEMQFDNREFEKHVQTSVDSLDKLKKSLDLEQSAKSFSELDKAAKSVNLSALTEAAEAVSKKFSFIGTVCDQVFRRITDAVLNAGAKVKGFVDELTIKPVATGFSEYETQINAIQTILSNTRDELTKKGLDDGARLELVNDKLDELNYYADKTIYNFTEMTKNIGTFTAAGVELETAVDSIQGIANLAAVSGSTSEQASRGMYQLSQAISTGTVKLMDWNSVVYSGMGGELFQKALMRTAEAEGIAGEEAQSMFAKLKAGQVSFRDSLSSGWLSADILTATLEQFSWDFEQMAKDMGYTAENMTEGIAKAMDQKKGELLAKGYSVEDAEEIVRLAKDATDAATKVKTFSQLLDTLKAAAQSGWTQTWETIIGDFEQAKELLTGISDYFGDIITASADARNKIMDGWANLGGRDELIQGFWNITAAIENIVGVVQKEFETIFPPATSEQLFALTKKIQEFTGRIKAFTENTEAMAKFGRIVAGVSAALDMLRMAAGWALGVLKRLFGQTAPVADGLLDAAAAMGDFLVRIRETLKESSLVQKILGGLEATVTAIRNVLTAAFGAIGKALGNVMNRIKASKTLTKIGETFASFTEKIPAGIEALASWGKTIIDCVRQSEALQKAWNSVKGFLGPIVKMVENTVSRIKEAIKGFFGADTSGKEGLWEKIKARFAAGFSSLAGLFADAKATLIAGWNRLCAFLAELFTKTIPEYLGGLKLKAISKWPWLQKIFDYFSQAWAKVKAFVGPVIEKIREMGTAVWDAVRNLFAGNENETADDGTSLGQNLIDKAANAWAAIQKSFSTLFNDTIPQWFEKLKGINWGGLIATVLGVFTGVKLMSAISGIGKLGKGFAAIGDGLKGIGKMLKDVGKEGLTVTKVIKNKDSFATSILKIAAAVGIMVAAVVVLASMPTEKAMKGIYMLGAIALELLAVTALFKMIGADGDSLLKAAEAVALMVVPIYLLGILPVKAAVQGIIAVGIIMAGLAGCMKLAENGLTGKQAFISLAVAVNLLAIAVTALGFLPIGNAAQGIIAVGLILAELTACTRLMKPNQVKGMISMALAVDLLVLAVRNLGRMKTGDLAKGVIGLGAVMGVFAVLLKQASGLKAGTSLATMALIAGSMIAFSFALKNLENMPWQTVAAFSAGISVIALAMALVTKILSGVSPLAAGKAAAALVIIAAGIGAAIAVLAGLVGSAAAGFSDDMVRIGANLKVYSNSVSGISTEKIRASITVLKEMAEAAGEIALTDTEGFEDFASQIAPLGAKLSLFSLLTAGIGEDGAAGAKKMVEDIGAMAEAMAEMQENELDLSLLGTALTTFGSGLELYAIACKDAEGQLAGTESTIDAKRITDLFTELGKVQIDKSTISGIAAYAAGGGSDLTSFALGLTALGNALQAYKTSIQGISLGDSFKAGATLGIINQLQKNLPIEKDGIIEWIAGKQQTLSSFGENIVLLGGALNSFSGSLTNDTAELSERGVGVVQALSDIQNELTKAGGVAQWFGGKQDLGDLGVNLITLGTGFSEFVGSLSDFEGKETFVGKATEVIDSLAEIQNKLTNTSGVAQWFTGTQNIGTFGSNLSTFATKFEEFCTTLSGVTIPENIESVSGVADKFADIAAKLNGVTPYDLSDYIKWIGEDLNTFFGSGRGGIGGVTVDQTKLTAITDFVESISGVVTQLDGIRADDYGFMQSLLDALAALNLPEVVGGAMGEIYAAIQNGRISFSTAVRQLIGAGEKTARATYGTWNQTGQYLASGISRGINAMAGTIRRAAVNAAAGAVRAIAITWAVHSPSRVGAELGMNFDLGIAGGIGDYSKVVSDQSKGVARSAADAAKTMLTGNGISVFDGLDPNPTIRPVLDLSGVQSGASAINSLFAGNPQLNPSLFQGLSVNRNAGMLNFDGAKILGGQSNRDVVNELKNLTERFNHLSEAVTNMQLVLDTGTLVGQTSAKMDRQLGLQASRRERGN